VLLYKTTSRHRRYFFSRISISLIAHLLIIVGAVAMLTNIDVNDFDYWLALFWAALHY